MHLMQIRISDCVRRAQQSLARYDLSAGTGCRFESSSERIPPGCFTSVVFRTLAELLRKSSFGIFDLVEELPLVRCALPTVSASTEGRMIADARPVGVLDLVCPIEAHAIDAFDLAFFDLVVSRSGDGRAVDEVTFTLLDVSVKPLRVCFFCLLACSLDVPLTFISLDELPESSIRTHVSHTCFGRELSEDVKLKLCFD